MQHGFNDKEVRRFENFGFLARQIVEGFIVGLHQSPFHGFSVEFAEHRLYNKGESTKDIDWKVYARTDRLYTKKYLEETNLRCQILIDVSPSMYYPKQEGIDSKYMFSATAAACLMYILRKQRDAYGLTMFDEEVEVHTPARSNPNHFNLVVNHLQEHLEAPNQNKFTDVCAALHRIADSIHRRSLVIIFSDMFDQSENPEELLSALQHLKYKKHEVILFHTLDKKLEVDFEFENRPYEFIDTETGERMKVMPKEVQEHYVSRMSEFYSRIKDSCLKYKIDYVQADINAGFDQILESYLVKRTKMRI